MKLYLFFLLMPIAVFPQSIINGNFESWNTTPYDVLTGWYNSNPESIAKTGLISVSKTSDSQSGFALRLETVSNGTDTAAGSFVNVAGDPLAGVGGFPFAQMPSHLSGYFKYSIPGNDTALLVVIFKSGGNIVSTDIFKIKGTGQQLTYVSFNFPLSLSITPDTVIVGATSSNQLTGQGIEPGSTIYFDQLAFTGAGPMPVLFNGDFELWSTGNYDRLAGWSYYPDNTINKTSDSYRGNYALKLESADYGGGNVKVGAVSSGTMTISGPAGGLPFSLQVDTLSGYYKYFNTSGDNGVVSMQLFSNGVNVGGQQLLLPPVAVYTRFQILINQSAPPDTMRIEIMSSTWPFMNVGSGSIFYIDEIQLASAPLSTSIRELNRQEEVRVYPNPATGELHMMLPDALKGSFTLCIAGMPGQEVLKRIITVPGNGEPVTVDLSGLTAGLYTWSVRNEKYRSNGKFNKQ